MVYEALEGLDARQQDAAACLENSVIAAGAGSGKTRVLAARYVWLVTEKHIPVDRIVTLTFTQKAVTEMYARIYAQLCRAAASNEDARTAVENFHTARIATLDSYCASIARNAARHFGLSPDFTVDVNAVRDQVRQQALPFILRNRNKKAVGLLLGERGIEDVTEGLFVKTFVNSSALSNPINFPQIFESQKNEIRKRWKQFASSLVQSVEAARTEFESITEASALKTVVYGNLKTFFENHSSPLKLPESEGQIPEFLESVYAFTCISYSGRTTNSALALIKSIRDEAKNHYKLCASAANFIVHEQVICELFELLAEFQESVNRQKRLSGCLTFADVSQLALDSLTRLSQIRQAEKNSISAIMIDEFQDNNEAQRNLLFLLAEKPDLCSQGIPSAEELCQDKLFFVGDEKQSIYKFRGADVSVFGKLKNELGEKAHLKNLSANYRSHPDLIAFFNSLFPSVFLNGDVPDYEAEYSPVESCPSLQAEAGGTARVSFFLFNAATGEDEEDVSDIEREAAFTAGRIRDMYENGYQVFGNDKGRAVHRPCRYGDFAILFRSYGRQHLFEKHLRRSGVPYTCENIAGFFNDAPVNDMYNLLRLIVYPLDFNAYAAVLRSPFAGLSRTAVLACLSVSGEILAQNRKQSIFCPEAEAVLSPGEQERYRSCRTLYERLCVLQNSMGTAELATFLWYETGYRFETLWNEAVQLYAELYDYFFELARQSDLEGLPLIGFIDRIAQIKASGERIDDTDIPPTRTGGVRLMSIHKSKGLEFPIVFVCEAGSQGRNLQNTDLCYFDGLYGFSVNLPRHPLIPFEKDGNCGNYFFNIQKELEENKNTAELRRLLYVALTRAESAVFVTGKYKLDKTKLEENASHVDALRMLAQSGGKIRSFLDLLLPFLTAAEPASAKGNLHRLEELVIPDYSANVSLPVKKEAFTAALPLYGAASGFAIRPPQQYRMAPSSLVPHVSRLTQNAEPEFDFGDGSAKLSGGESDAADMTCIEQIVGETNGAFTQADFGTIAHAHVEALFTGEKPRVQSRVTAVLTESQFDRLNAVAARMAENFAQSPLGQRAKNAKWLKSEFAFKSRVTLASQPGGFVLLAGQIDLVFENGNQIYIVDFKTDQIEEQSRHITQLAAYNSAVSQIFGKNALCLLYYLRTGHAEDVTSSVLQVDIGNCIALSAAAL